MVKNAGVSCVVTLFSFEGVSLSRGHWIESGGLFLFVQEAREGTREFGAGWGADKECV